jgi:hypothetical protein
VIPRPPARATSKAARCSPGGPLPPAVEADHAAGAVGHRAFGDPQGHGRIVLAEGAVDDAGPDAEVTLAAREAAPLRRDDLVERQAGPGAQLGAVADLEEAHAVRGGVLHHLVGRPLDRLGGLEQGDRDVEPAEVVLEIGGASTSMCRSPNLVGSLYARRRRSSTMVADAGAVERT